MPLTATTIDLIQNGWPTISRASASATGAQAPHEANLFDMNANYADGVSLADAYVESVPGKVGVPA